MNTQTKNRVEITRASQIACGIGGFLLSTAMVVFAAAGLQLISSAIWPPPQSFLVACAVPIFITIAALAVSWACLLKMLQNRAMILGVWCQIYTVVGIAGVGLAVVLFW